MNHTNPAANSRTRCFSPPPSSASTLELKPYFTAVASTNSLARRCASLWPPARNHGVGCGGCVERCNIARGYFHFTRGSRELAHRCLCRGMLWRRPPWEASGCKLNEKPKVKRQTHKLGVGWCFLEGGGVSEGTATVSMLTTMRSP